MLEQKADYWTTACVLIFMGFNVRSFCGLPAIHESFVCENSDINGYARYNGRSNDDVMHRKMPLTVFYTAGKRHSLGLPVLLLLCALFLVVVECVFLLYWSPNMVACQI